MVLSGVLPYLDHFPKMYCNHQVRAVPGSEKKWTHATGPRSKYYRSPNYDRTWNSAEVERHAPWEI
jgi:hypothetical protein